MEIDPRLRSDHGQASHLYPPPPRAPGASPSTPLGSNSSRLPLPQQYQDGSHQPLYPSPTPQSLGNENPGSQTNGDGTPDDTKRPRACEACRGLKVRCEFDPNNHDGPCKRCAKANRNCVVTVPSRKRQKKTDSRVAELEKKIDALTATLQASKSGSISVGHRSDNGAEQESFTAPARLNAYEQVTNGGYGKGFESRPEPRRVPSESEGKRANAPPMVIAGQKRKLQGSVDTGSTPASSTSIGSGKGNTSNRTPTSQYPFEQAQPTPAPKAPNPTHEYADVIDRGIISTEYATQMFNHYVTNMAPHLPAVVFPENTTASEIRRSKSTLFLAILGAAAGNENSDIQKALTKEVMQVYAERIICNGEKSLELIQAMTVSTLWYWPPEHFEELKFYQLVHMAAVMAIDINIGRKSKHKSRILTNPPGLWRDHPWKRHVPTDPDSIEARRAWLACYFMSAATAMGLRRPNLVRWTSYTANCVEVLETSPEAAPSDKLLCQWVRSQRIAEEVGEQFSMDDADAVVSIADQKVQYALKGFERDLKYWSDQVPKEVQSTTLKLTEHVVSLYMHEIAMHVDHNIDEFQPPFSDEGFRNNRVARDDSTPLSAAHISALSTCLTSIDGVFEAFLSLDVHVIRNLPVIVFVRTAYAVVVIIKMYFAASAPNSEFGKVIDKDNMKVEQYLDGLLVKFRATAAQEKSRIAGKFLMVLVMLKTWFHRSKSGRLPLTRLPDGATIGQAADPGAQTPGPTGQTPAQQVFQHQQSRDYSPANTPLQLLSEIATGGTPRPESRNQFAQSPAWANGGQQYNPADSNFANQMQSYGMAMGGPYANIDPALSMGPPEYNFMGDGLNSGFAEAMGLGEGGFANYFADGSFWGAMMDSVGGQGAPPFDPF